MLRQFREEIIDHRVNAVGWLPSPLLPGKTIVERPHGVVQPELYLVVDFEIDLGPREFVPYQIHQFESGRTWPAEEVIYHFDAFRRCLGKSDDRERGILEVENGNACLWTDPDREGNSFRGM